MRREAHWFDDMDRAFDTLTHRGWLTPFNALWPEWSPRLREFDLHAPRVDLIERDAEIVVRAEMPGIDKKDLDVDLAGDILTLRGERQTEEKTETGNVYRAEIARGRFLRSLRLPAEVDADKIDAVFENGVLEIHLPKRESTPKQRIEVK
jgi:HSP20 family protein